MKKKSLVNHLKGLVILPLILIGFTTCTKEEKSGFGTYFIGVHNDTQSSYAIKIYFDDEYKGYFIVQAAQSIVPSDICADLTNPNRANIWGTSYVPSGEHKVKILYDPSGAVFSEYTFKMKADDCQFQKFYWY